MVIEFWETVICKPDLQIMRFLENGKFPNDFGKSSPISFQKCMGRPIDSLPFSRKTHNLKIWVAYYCFQKFNDHLPYLKVSIFILKYIQFFKISQTFERYTVYHNYIVYNQEWYNSILSFL